MAHCGLGEFARCGARIPAISNKPIAQCEERPDVRMILHTRNRSRNAT
jgi:hypothetical protein